MAVIRGLVSHSPPADFKMATAPLAIFQKLPHWLLLQRIAVPWERQGPRDQGLLSGDVQPILPLMSLPNVPQRPQRRRLRNGTEPLNRPLRRLARRTRPSLTLSRLLPGHPPPCRWPILSLFEQLATATWSPDGEGAQVPILSCDNELLFGPIQTQVHWGSI